MALIPPTTIKEPTQRVRITKLRAAGDVRGGGTGREFLENLMNESTEPWDKWLHMANSSWVEGDFAEPAIVSSYTLVSANDVPDRDPKDWTLFARYADGTYAELSKLEGVLFTSRWAHKTFPVAERCLAVGFRLEIHSNRRPVGCLQLGHLYFHPVAPETIAAPIALTDGTAKAGAENVGALISKAGGPEFIHRHAGGTTWVEATLDAPAPVKLGAYALVSGAGSAGNDPAAWKLLGRKPDGSWVPLDRMPERVHWEARGQRLVFHIPSPEAGPAVSAVRLEVEGTVHGNSVQMGGLMVYAAAAAADPDAARAGAGGSH